MDAGAVGGTGGSADADAGGSTGGMGPGGAAGSGGADDPDAGAPPGPVGPVTRPVEGVLREVIHIAGVVPPPNPATGDATPDDLNFTQVLRYRRDQDGPARPDAILVAMPGFLAGGGTFDPLARHLVRRANVEFWAIDRRSNLLEDLFGSDVAEARQDPSIAAEYYFGGATIDGRTFEGLVDDDDVPYMSEWGLAVHVEDLRRVIEQVPEAARRGNVFLVGHSLGASFAELFAAWRFEDGVRGADLLAGVILMDGALGATPGEEMVWREGGGGGFMPSPGVQAVRDSDRTTAIPFLGADVYLTLEIGALRAAYDPGGVVEDPKRDSALRLLFSIPVVPAMTNKAVVGMALSIDYNPLAFVTANLGQATGGPVAPYQNVLSMSELLQPTDPMATYDWVDGDDADPPSFTTVADIADAMLHGRSNLVEWYFPTRLPLDISAVGGAAVPEDGWQAAEGLRAFDGRLMDAPILSIPGGLAGPEGMAAVADRVAAEIGPDRPQAGATGEARFRTVDATFMEHLDVTTAVDDARNPIPSAIVEFIEANAAAGPVELPDAIGTLAE
jgi:pimeloyl-ACP methyl ester carboxylesterase